MQHWGDTERRSKTIAVTSEQLWYERLAQVQAWPIVWKFMLMIPYIDSISEWNR